MADERNALAELAERLEQIAEVERESAVFHGDPLDASDDIDKARRIVAELAKLFTKSPEGKTCLDVRAPWCPPLEKCRAIAEEGANNG